jgi:hypothetical protein
MPLSPKEKANTLVKMPLLILLYKWYYKWLKKFAKGHKIN